MGSEEVALTLDDAAGARDLTPVLAEWRGRGIGQALHDRLSAESTEPLAHLTVQADAIGAQKAYRSWGWVRVRRAGPRSRTTPGRHRGVPVTGQYGRRASPAASARRT
jgi:GNAT superfamily N-acetyltransferase